MNIQDQIDALQKQIDDIRMNQFGQSNIQNDYINIQNIIDFVEVVSTIPSHIPRTLYEQIKIHINGGTMRLYVYDYKASAWRYTTLT